MHVTSFANAAPPERNEPARERAVMLKVLAAASALILGSRAALAGPPFLTDDPAPVDYRHAEFYVFSTYDKTIEADDSALPAFEFNYGVLPNTQLHLVVPFVHSVARDASSESGIGDVEIGVKYRFVQETESSPQVGIFPMAELPTGDSDKGLGNGKTWWRLPVWVQKSWGEWTTYGGIGYAINSAEGQSDYSFAGWLLQKDVGAQWTLGGEIFARGKDTVDGESTTIVNLGGFYKFKANFNLLFSAGHSVSGESHTVAYLGLWWSFGADENSEHTALDIGRNHWPLSQR
jgi:hypothetical protein